MAEPPSTPWLAPNISALTRALGVPVDLGPGAGRWHLESGPDGPFLQLRTAAGALVAAHSRRHPGAEAARLVDDALAGRAWPPAALVIGAGLGTSVATILERDPSIRVLVVEPDPSGAAALLGHRDWTAAIDGGRLLVLAGPDFRGVDRAWRFVPASDTPPLVVVHPVLAREYPEDVRRAAAVASRVLGDARANAGAEAALAGPYLRHTIANLGLVAHEGDVDALAGAFEGVPAIVAAAGPSLDTVVADLARLQDRAVVIAVDTALRPLLAQGVTPHLTVAVDPSERNARHLTGLDGGAFGTWLVTEPSVHPTALPAFAGRTFAFRVGDNHPWPWLASLGVRRGTLAAWGSVLVSALDLATRIGARPIAIVGADLAYTGGQPYCRGTTFEEDWAREVRHGSPLADIWARVAARPGAQQQPDVHGQPVATLPHLVAFRDHLRERIADSGARVVNATGAGILHGPGVVLGTLDDAFAGVAIDAGAVRERLHEIHRRSVAEGGRAAATLTAALADADTTDILAALVPAVEARGIESSVAHARAAVAAAPTNRPRTHPTAEPKAAPIWLPEQAAALAALRSGTATHPPLGEDGAPPTAGDVMAAAAAVLAHSPLSAGPVDAAVLRAELLALPLPALLPIAPDARRAVDHLGALLTRWIRAAPPARPPDPYWQLASTSLGPERTVATLEDSEAVARFAVVTTVAWVAARTGHAGDAVGRLAARLAATGPPTAYGASEGPRVTITAALAGASPSWIAEAPLAAYARALSGALFAGVGPSPATSEPALTLGGVLSLPGTGAAPQEWRLLPGPPARRLTPDHCGPCVFATVHDDECALASRFDQAGSYLVGATGMVTDAPRWPRPIVGEGRWEDGRSFGWGHTPPGLVVRDASGVATYDETLPFSPTEVVKEGAGLRFASRDGVWRWTPDSGLEHLVTTAPLVATFVEADGSLRLVRLPVDRQPGAAPEPDLIWRQGEPLREAPAEPLGPCWSKTVAGEWRAEALPAADLVRVSGPGTSGWIACEAPRSVAWAGDALLIVLIGGTVLHVANVRGRLARR